MKNIIKRGEKIRLKGLSDEKQICDERGLLQIGGNHTKVDGSNGQSNESIKSFGGASTQVHLTTQKKFIELGLNEESKVFIKLFCGNETIDFKGRDRYEIPDINPINVNAMLDFLNKNKKKVIQLVICNNDNINTVVYRNSKNNEILVLSLSTIFDKVDECTWVALKGGIHLKNKKNETYFHLQREGKKNKSNRYNVLFHIHANLFKSD
jgi:hypothetical protein